MDFVDARDMPRSAASFALGCVRNHETPTQPTAYSYFCRPARLRRGFGALAMKMCGAARRVLQRIADYIKLRVAFRKPIGSYRRVEDQCCDIGNVKLTYYVARAIDGKQPNAPPAVWMADAGHKMSNMGSSCIAASA